MPRCHAPPAPDACRLCRRYAADREGGTFRRMLDAPAATDDSSGCGQPDLSGRRRVVVPSPPPLDVKPTSDRAVVTVAAGEVGRTLLALTGDRMRAYATTLGADLVVLDWPGEPSWPMSAKFAIGTALGPYRRVAYLDADVLVGPDTIDLFAACDPSEMGVVDEMAEHRARSAYRRLGGYHAFRKALGLPDRADSLPWYFNAGVMVVPESHRTLLLPPPYPVPVGHCSEQDHTNAALLASGLPYRLLDKRCNWQWWTDHGFKAAPPGSVLHFSGVAGTARLDEIRGRL